MKSATYLQAATRGRGGAFLFCQSEAAAGVDDLRGQSSAVSQIHVSRYLSWSAVDNGEGKRSRFSQVEVKGWCLMKN